MEKVLSLNHDLVQHARKTPGLKVFGTDAVAGAHGRHREFIDRVRDGGVDLWRRWSRRTRPGAEALGLRIRSGSIAPGMQADIIALNGDPLKDITAVRRVAFVMKGGIVYKMIARYGIAEPKMTVGSDEHPVIRKTRPAQQAPSLLTNLSKPDAVLSVADRQA